MDDQKEKADEIFRGMQSQLLYGKYWTFDAFRKYNLKLYELYGGHKSKAKPSRKKNETDEEYQERMNKWETDVLKKMDPSVRALRQKIQILDCLNPVELASNHKSIFSLNDKREIARRAKVPLKEVDAIILEHDGLRADRLWYQIRTMMNKPLPEDMDERERLSSLDRPFSRSEMELAKSHQEERMKSARRNRKSPKRIASFVFRTPSKGINRWSRD
jgi:hypothetical protein